MPPLLTMLIWVALNPWSARVGSARNLELLDGVLRKDHSRRNQSRVRVDQAIQRVVVAFRAAAVHADGIAFSLAHRALLTADRDGAGAHQEQLHEVAPVQRKLFNLLLADQVGELSAVSVERDRLRRCFNGLCDGARFQLGIDTQPSG